MIIFLSLKNSLKYRLKFVQKVDFRGVKKMSFLLISLVFSLIFLSAFILYKKHYRKNDLFFEILREKVREKRRIKTCPKSLILL